MGDRDGLVAVTDDAEPRIHTVFLRRSDGSAVCALPVFEEGRSGTDVSVVGLEHADERGNDETVYKLRTGRGLGYNNRARALFLHRDGAAAYSTTIFALVMIRDTDGIAAATP